MVSAHYYGSCKTPHNVHSTGKLIILGFSGFLNSVYREDVETQNCLRFKNINVN
jgi:hypothetical protein